MKEFDEVIGYAKEKEELMQICDMLRNAEFYERLGAKIPKGVLIEGEPGIGKTLLATSFIKASGLKSYVVRRSLQKKGFAERLEHVFEEAKKNAPSIILLDDMDKFAAEKDNKEEFIAVQTCIDSIKDEQVFVIATANYTKDIPRSLLRAGRFDRRLNMTAPSGEDSLEIISHYMSQKSFLKNINVDDMAKMLQGLTCAELETVINEASVYAGYERKEQVEREHMIKAYIKQERFISDDGENCDPDELEAIAYHEAGHLIMSDIILTDSVGIAVVGNKHGGAVKRCKELKRRPYEVLVSLAGKASVELMYGKVASGSFSDIRRAASLINDGYECSATGGFSLSFRQQETQTVQANRELATGVKLEEYMFKAKEIIASNMEYLHRIAKELIEKRTLLNSDIRKIRETVTVKRVDIA